MGLYYPTQDNISTKLGKENIIKCNLLTGFLLGFYSTPISCIRTPLLLKNITLLESTRYIYKKYGFRGFFRGGYSITSRDIV